MHCYLLLSWSKERIRLTLNILDNAVDSGVYGAYFWLVVCTVVLCIVVYGRVKIPGYYTQKKGEKMLAGFFSRIKATCYLRKV